MTAALSEHARQPGISNNHNDSAMHGVDFSLPLTNPVMIFSLVMMIILVVPLLFERLRIPGMVGLIIAGVIIGPHAFGVLERDQTVELLGTVGLLYIMFVAGIEVDLNEFSRQRKRSAIFGFMTFILPLGFGALAGIYILDFSVLSSWLLGALFASNTLLTYPIVSRFGLAKAPEVTTAVGATILTDTAALLVLAVVVRLSEGAAGPIFWVQMTVMLSLYIFLTLWGVPRVGQWFFRRVRSNGVAEFVFVLAVVFFASVMAEVIGIEAIIGAFLAGLALNRLVPDHSTLMSRTQFVGNALFIPFFLISVGMLVDLRILVSGAGAWIVAGVMVATLMITKWMAAYSTRPLFGYSSDQAWLIYGLTVPQAAATLATVMVGYRVGLFGDDVLNGSILMILITCMIGPLITEKYGRRVALQKDATPFQPGTGPQRILVPLANPATAPDLIDLALMLRSSTSHEPIFPLAVARDMIHPEAGVAESEKLLSHAVSHGVAGGVPIVPLVRVDRNVSEGILRAIREQRISTVVIGWDGAGSSRDYVFGSILDQLLAASRELVLVSRISQPLNTVSRLVLIVPPDAEREPGFSNVLGTAKILASQVSARIVLVGTSSSVQSATRMIGPLKPEVPVEPFQLESWARLFDRLDAELSPEDMIWLASTRQGSLSWKPALLRLPRLLASRFTESSLVVSYAPLPAQDVNAYQGAIVEAAGLYRPENIHLGVEGDTAFEIGEQILSGHESLLQAFRDVRNGDGVREIAPGVVLFHTLLPDLVSPEVHIGISPGTFDAPSISQPAKILVVVAGAEWQPSERHLQVLSIIGRTFRHPATVTALRESTAPSAAREVMLGAIRLERPVAPTP